MAFDLGMVGSDVLEVYGRVVNAVDNFAFGFSTTGAFSIDFIFGGYDLAAGGSELLSGFVVEGADAKTATFRLLDADDGFSVVEEIDFTTDLTGGPSGIFSGGAGSYVIQVDGSGVNAGGIGLYDIRVSQVPLPASSLLLIAGVAGLGAVRRRQR